MADIIIDATSERKIPQCGRKTAATSPMRDNFKKGRLLPSTDYDAELIGGCGVRDVRGMACIYLYTYTQRCCQYSSLSSTYGEEDGELALLSSKRKFNDVEKDEDENENEDDNKISRLLAEAEQSGISQLNAAGLKSLLLVSFEKKITKNQKLRVKYPNDPDKFMASEMELHEEIQELHIARAILHSGGH
eukprot:gene24474-32925_t